MEMVETEDKVNLDEETPTEDDVTNDERARIRSEISTMSFKELQELKEKIGIKTYNEAIFGVVRTPKTDFKRANKNRPREMSSKKRTKLTKVVAHLKKPTARDPRFDPLCGTYNDEVFKENYKFLYGMRKKEHEQLQKQYEDSENTDEKKKIKSAMQRLGNQIREHEKKQEEKEKLKREKHEIRDKLKRGEKPVFKRKSEKKLEDLVQKYEELKKSNKLQKHIEKRSKKLASKHKKHLD